MDLGIDRIIHGLRTVLLKAGHNDFGERFAELSDAGLLSINRDDLVDLARECYDSEVARRGLQCELDVREEPKPFLELVEVVDTKDDFAFASRPHARSVEPVNANGLFRPVLDLLRHFLTATLGTAIAESSVQGIYHPKSIAGVLAKGMTLNAVIALLLGIVVQRIWPSNTARWMALLGVLTFAATLFFRPETVLDPGSPFSLSMFFERPTDWYKLTLWFVSVRLIAYSFGAFCCATFLRERAARMLPNR
jgi:lambda repressor-like predicted transcriptional regulator